MVADLVMPVLREAETVEPDGRLDTAVDLEADVLPDAALLTVAFPDIADLPAVLLLVPVPIRAALAVLLPDTVRRVPTEPPFSVCDLSP